MAFTTFSTLGIKESSRTGAKGICVFGGVTFIIGLSKFQKPFSATKEDISDAILDTLEALGAGSRL